MLNKKKSDQLTIQNINIIGNATKLVGDLTSSGDIRIDGQLEGNLETTAKLVSGAGSRIKGDITAQQADISGLIEGNIRVKDMLVLKSSARIKGNIYAKKMMVEPGAKFDGQCNMEVTETINLSQPQSATEGKRVKVDAA